jgi:hypothetical protein
MSRQHGVGDSAHRPQVASAAILAVEDLRRRAELEAGTAVGEVNERLRSLAGTLIDAMRLTLMASVFFPGT